MFIKQAFFAKHEWWRYLIGVIIIFIAWQIIGGIPLLAALFLEGGIEVFSMTQGEMLRVLDSNLSFFLLLLSFAIALGALFLVVKYWHNQSLREATTSREKVDWGRFFFGFGLVAAYTIIALVIDYNLSPENYLWNFDFVPFAILLLIGLVMVPLQTSFEEYLFRGYLMQGLGVIARNRWVPLLITSVIFGSMHILNPEVTQLGYIIMVYYIGTGLLLGIMTLMDDGLELALGFHAGNNLVGALLVTADWTAFQTNSVLKDISDPSAGFEVIVPIFIIYPLFLFFMAKKYGWKNWRERLFGEVEPPAETNYLEEI